MKLYHFPLPFPPLNPPYPLAIFQIYFIFICCHMHLCIYIIYITKKVHTSGQVSFILQLLSILPHSLEIGYGLAQKCEHLFGRSLFPVDSP